MCLHGCSANYRANFLRFYPQGYPLQNGAYICVLCGGAFAWQDITIDHIIPQAIGQGMPNLHCIQNLQPMCRSCNSSKNKHMSVTDVERCAAAG